MNENTTKLIEQLAQKMGTTSEYLWGVLVRQAPIDATANLLMLTILPIASYVVWRIDKRIYSTGLHLDEDDDPSLLGIGMAFISCVVWLFTFSTLFSIGDIIDGFFSPDFWALNYIMETLK